MSAGKTDADWIAVDWGTSNCRAWAMSAAGEVLAEAASDKGMGSLRREEFEPALLEMVAPWLGKSRTPVVACGMVGSRQGWAEAPYRAVPCTPRGDRLVEVRANDPRLQVWLIPGLKQNAPADVMRGEETQIAGYLAGDPGFDGVLCLPGTHTKWCQISAGEVVSFRTFMTGELFALLSKSSVLRHSMGEGWNDDAFAEAVADTLSRPEALAQRLFSIRADGLLNGPDGAAAKARLSGLLIGAELAAAKPYWLGQSIVQVGAPALTGLYAAALGQQGATVREADGAAMTLAGLGAAFRSLKETIS